MLRNAKSIVLTLAVVLVVAGGYLIAGPARGAREDISEQRQLVAAQLTTVRMQLRLQQRQLAVAEQQLAVARDIQRTARQTLAHTVVIQQIAARTERDANSLVAITRAVLALARDLKDIAQQTARHAANIDRKTGPAPTSPR